MKDTTSVSVQVGGATMTIETGLLARQAAGATVCRLGDSLMFSAVTCTDKPREGVDFFPLQVEYREKYYAAGRFPGGYFKREARPSEKEILTARITDRPIRPLFPEGYRNDVQVNNMVLSADGENETDILSVNAASAALHISDIPFMGPVGCVRVGRINGEFVINPTHTQRKESDLDLIYAGTRERFLMMEGAADEISEEDFLAAMKFGHAEVVKIVDAQHELRRMLGKPEKVITEVAPDAEKMAFLYANGESALRKALLIADKLERQNAVTAIKEELLAKTMEKWPEEIDAASFVTFFDTMEIDLVRRNILEDGKRIDGRANDEIRKLYAQIGVMPRAHGSAIFDRGETSALGSVTLGTKKDAQELDAITGGDPSKSFMLHYNFPPYCVGEVGRLGSTGRREIGHGALAERSLAPVVPQDYPYSIRVVSDIMGSNGSSSMASICVGSLALMDAGIPIKAPVAGVSVGLFTSKDESQKILVTDILGSEDHCGDMDFKVAGTRKGITGFQVDLKLRGLTWDVVEAALARAKKGRLQILDFMASVLPEPRAELAAHAPRITVMTIPVDKIGALIGPGGANIRRICEISGAQIDIEDDGTVSIFANNAESLAIAQHEVASLTAEAEEGKIYGGTVTGIKEFGCFVEILPGKDGLCHISELADRRIGSVEDICKVGDKMTVKCIGVDDRGRIKLSRREAMRDLDAQKQG
ncbi:MAG: polyribonucleotide nucleotidyltransferase [Kiritimatiellae bacterium]|jgi:polyribonucleotide nucleotidyltransferase|nr:polyribonucleotide nucleotidyltransferase [Kiritimatiellia bacterium]MDD3583077.1 polyribonucleotide nucleotidyltransferase [Kiritimatiellia bacterium]HHU14210.1 polyribonucleotide nucleotidyltransferase [Lentisphaerota bacterium]HON46349.1 polyribonucleotide nucleotidyltransferase [Kiritimatiellia bacterium]